MSCRARSGNRPASASARRPRRSARLHLASGATTFAIRVRRRNAPESPAPCRGRTGNCRYRSGSPSARSSPPRRQRLEQPDRQRVTHGDIALPAPTAPRSGRPARSGRPIQSARFQPPMAMTPHSSSSTRRIAGLRADRQRPEGIAIEVDLARRQNEPGARRVEIGHDPSPWGASRGLHLSQIRPSGTPLDAGGTARRTGIGVRRWHRPSHHATCPPAIWIDWPFTLRAASEQSQSAVAGDLLGLQQALVPVAAREIGARLRVADPFHLRRSRRRCGRRWACRRNPGRSR
jgi:hypothetical protein